jgi:SAM-dependent methyltransferase
MMSNARSFEEWVRAASSAEFSGWDFSHLAGRCDEEELSWDYVAAVRKHLATSSSLLDMGTGGGERLSSLCPLPQVVCATEAYAPNVPIAKKRLEPLGVKVVQLDSDDALPFDDGYFDLVINRHESFCAGEVFRVMKGGGRFITQQVGDKNNVGLNRRLGCRDSAGNSEWSLERAGKQLRQVGFTVSSAYEEFPATRFFDVGAVIYYLRAVPWQIPDFEIDAYEAPLRKLHQSLEETGALEIKAHRFFLECIKG